VFEDLVQARKRLEHLQQMLLSAQLRVRALESLHSPRTPTPAKKRPPHSPARTKLESDMNEQETFLQAQVETLKGMARRLGVPGGAGAARSSGIEANKDH
jgi:hypothetical protein